MWKGHKKELCFENLSDWQEVFFVPGEGWKKLLLSVYVLYFYERKLYDGEAHMWDLYVCI